MPDLGGDDRLNGRRQRGVTDGDGLVVIKVTHLLCGIEGVATQIERQDQVGLLDDLARVEKIVVVVEKERVVLSTGCLEVPAAVAGETFRLSGNTEFGVER